MYWNAFKHAVADLKEKHPMSEEDEAALAISAQGETIFFLDKDGKDLRNAIVWMDNRAQEEAEFFKEKFGDETCYKVTGQVSFEPCWPASKILWVKNHEPEVFAKTAKFLLIEDYFIYRMTGKFATEGSLVCSSTYWDIIKKEYWPEMLECLGVKEDQLAPVYESGEVVGTIIPEVAEELGLLKILRYVQELWIRQPEQSEQEIPMRECSLKPSEQHLQFVAPVARPVFDPNRRMPLHYFANADTYMIHTFTNGGMTLRWFRDKFCQIEMQAQELGLDDAYNMISKEVSKVPAGSDGLVMLPHLAGSNAPDVNAKAKGVWFGFTLQHTRAHFMRSVMESLGYIVKRNIDSLADMGIEVKEIRSLGGGSKSDVWNQIKSDICQIPLETVNSIEAASLGAAILAGKATGIFKNLNEAAESMVQVKKRTLPNTGNKTVYEDGYEMYRKLFGDLDQCFKKSI